MDRERMFESAIATALYASGVALLAFAALLATVGVIATIAS